MDVFGGGGTKNAGLKYAATTGWMDSGVSDIGLSLSQLNYCQTKYAIDSNKLRIFCKYLTLTPRAEILFPTQLSVTILFLFKHSLDGFNDDYSWCSRSSIILTLLLRSNGVATTHLAPALIIQTLLISALALYHRHCTVGKFQEPC